MALSSLELMGNVTSVVTVFSWSVSFAAVVVGACLAGPVIGGTVAISEAVVVIPVVACNAAAVDVRGVDVGKGATVDSVGVVLAGRVVRVEPPPRGGKTSHVVGQDVLTEVDVPICIPKAILAVEYFAPSRVPQRISSHVPGVYL